MSGDEIVVTGTVDCIWDSSDSDEHMLINIEPDIEDCPNSFEIMGSLRDEIVADLTEGDRIELRYKTSHHEIVDPDSATTRDSSRTRLTAIKILS